MECYQRQLADLSCIVVSSNFMRFSVRASRRRWVRFDLCQTVEGRAFVRESDLPDQIQIEEWRPAGSRDAALDHDLDMLSDILHAVVHVGAGVSFVVPFSLDDAREFWVIKVLPGVRARTRRVLLARSNARIVGTVQLDLAMPPNQRHRAEVAKLLVHPDARRRGIARALMVASKRSHCRKAVPADTRHLD